LKFFFIEDSQAGVNNQGGIENAPVLGDFIKSFVNPHGGSIRTMGCHGLHHVGDAYYARRHENIIPGKTPWIAGPVQSFMVLQNDFGNGPGELYAFQNIVTGLGVGLDQTNLNVG
jgi:hypothetical protein